jgi:hypothetical protein
MYFTITVKNIIKNIIIPLIYFVERKTVMSQQLLRNFTISHGRFFQVCSARVILHTTLKPVALHTCLFIQTSNRLTGNPSRGFENLTTGQTLQPEIFNILVYIYIYSKSVRLLALSCRWSEVMSIKQEKFKCRAFSSCQSRRKIYKRAFIQKRVT